MLENLKEKWPRFVGLTALALAYAVFQYFFVPISIHTDSRGFYVAPTSFLHGSDKIRGHAEAVCKQRGLKIMRFRMSTKSMGGKTEHVYRFDCGVQ